MAEDYYLGIDIGSSSLKVALLSKEGDFFARKSKKYQIKSKAPGRAVHEPKKFWWDNLQDLLSDLWQEIPGDKEDIKAIGLTGLVPVFTALNNQGEVLPEAILHIDNRASEEAEYLQRELRLNVSTENILPTICWLAQQKPSLFQEIDTVLSPHGYLVYRLTGEKTLDKDSALMIGEIYNPKDNSWAEPVLEKLGLAKSLFPLPQGAAKIAGGVTKKVAEETGLPAGVPVITGTGDSFATLLGSGTYNPEQALIYLGTSATYIKLDSSVDNYINKPHFKAGRARFLTKVLSCGESLEKLSRTFNRGLEELNKAAANLVLSESPPLFYPDFRSRQASGLLGTGALLLNWQINQGYPHLYRALLESIAFRLARAHFSQDKLPQEINICGGCTQSELFLKIIANFCQQKVRHIPEAGADLGACLIASRAVGDLAIADWKNILDRFASNNVIPELEQKKYYNQLYEKYQHQEKLLTKVKYN